MSRTMVSHTPSFAWHAHEVSSAQSVLLLEVMSHVCPSSLPESGTDCLSALLFIEITCPALFLKGGTAPPRAPPVANQATGGETKNPVPRCW